MSKTSNTQHIRYLVIGVELNRDDVECLSCNGQVGWPTDAHDTLDDYTTIVICPSHGINIPSERQEQLKRFLSSTENSLVVIGPRTDLSNVIPGSKEPTVAPGSNITLLPEGELYKSWYSNVHRHEIQLAPPANVASSKWFIGQSGTRPVDKNIHAVTKSEGVIGYDMRLGTNVLSANIVVLPRTSVGLFEQNVLDLLEQHFGLSGKSDQPDWLDQRFTAPGHATAQSSLARAEKALGAAQKAVENAEANVTETAEPLRLLYEQGTELENAVIAAMLELGAEIVEGPTPENHDGVVRAPDSTLYVLEVKGVGKSMSLAHARQIDNWVTDLNFEREEKLESDVVGVLVGNPFRNTDPDDRESELPDNVQKYLDQRDYRYVSTVDLLAALNNTVGTDKFWADLKSQGTGD